MKKLVLVVTAVLAVAGAALFITVNFIGGPELAAKAGECVAVSNQAEDDRADVANAGCETALYKVGTVVADANGKCPPSLSDYAEVVAKSGGGRLCLVPNLLEGGCYRPVEDTEGWGKSACTDPDAVKVTKIIPGMGDTAGCPETEEGIAYPEPAVTYCLKPVQG
ncbi:hypothetical protein DMH04_54960 [Kibdelosporangium aridum]|uniref:Uncharacterized protein n=1 Tax=Kibdelosporangium aridum TaxID=2030 RepID=A0A428XX53_KIBAR|nr:hypothetical protein [Kibdelosporangium aridum]RSM59946.1 hypothetical protein DMH04_54960 [Kibdelosporangium aridum]